MFPREIILAFSERRTILRRRRMTEGRDGRKAGRKIDSPRMLHGRRTAAQLSLVIKSALKKDSCSIAGGVDFRKRRQMVMRYPLRIWGPSLSFIPKVQQVSDEFLISNTYCNCLYFELQCNVTILVHHSVRYVFQMYCFRIVQHPQQACLKHIHKVSK